MYSLIKRTLIIGAIAMSTIGGLSCAKSEKVTDPPADCNYEGFTLQRDVEGCFYRDSEGARHNVASSYCDCL